MMAKIVVKIPRTNWMVIITTSRRSPIRKSNTECLADRENDQTDLRKEGENVSCQTTRSTDTPDRGLHHNNAYKGENEHPTRWEDTPNRPKTIIPALRMKANLMHSTNHSKAVGIVLEQNLANNVRVVFLCLLA